jgi:hypothetical protein
MPGARCARSLACKIKKHTSVVTTVTPGSPGIPRAMVLTVSFVLSPVTGLVCHRHRRSFLRQLDTSVGASGPHDFAVRSKRHSSKAPPRPPHPAAHVRDDRETPLERRRDGFAILLILPGRQAKFLKFRNRPKDAIIRLAWRRLCPPRKLPDLGCGLTLRSIDPMLGNP